MDILIENDDYIILRKPAGVVLFDIQSLLISKKELITKTVYDLEEETEGICILLKNKELVDPFRNWYGSEGMEFSFQFLTRHPHAEEHIEVNLPIAEHTTLGKMVISHSTGKKAKTIFSKLQSFGQYTLWEAKLNYLRRHQVRLHAADIGIPIIGENIYGNEPLIYMSDLKRFNKRALSEQPIYPSLVIHLTAVQSQSEKLMKFCQSLTKSHNHELFYDSLNVNVTMLLNKKFQLLVKSLSVNGVKKK